jgi:hypothetical protein
VLALLLAPFVIQAAAMLVDEGIYHRRRGLPRWERLGHPADTLTVLACYAWLLWARPSPSHAMAYGALAAFSSLFVTKDEAVHARRCSAGEHWVHALLFLLHPLVFLAAGTLWWTGRLRPVLVTGAGMTAAFGTYQLLYWNGPWRRAQLAR